MANTSDRVPKYTYHFGASMFPLLADYDFLDITVAEKLLIGDIILYESDESMDADEWIAHRIVKIKDEKIYTKGDNNPTIDDGNLHHDEIMGIVTARWRNGKKLKIYRGKKGMIQYRLYMIYFRARKILKVITNTLILPKRFRSTVRALFPKPKEIYFTREYRRTKALYLGKIRIGTYSERNKCWQIRFPYRLIYTK